MYKKKTMKNHSDRNQIRKIKKNTRKLSGKALFLYILQLTPLIN